MIVVSGKDTLHDEAIKHHEQNEKDYEKAMKENKDAVDLVSGDNTKKKDGKVKSKELKKMHLSEDLFIDMFESLSDVDKRDLDVLDKLKNFSPQPNKDKLYDLLDRQIVDKNWLIEELISVISDDQAEAIIRDVDYDEDLEEGLQINEASFGNDFLDKVAEKVVGSISEEVELNEDDETSPNNIDDNEFNIDSVTREIENNYPKHVEVYNTSNTSGDTPYYTVQFLVDGDWKHDHLAFKYWMDQNAEELCDCTIKYGGEDVIEEDGSDNYSAIHEYYFIPNSEEGTIKSEENTEEIIDTEPEEKMPEEEFDEDSIVAESLKFKIAKEQLKRFNENKMPNNWSPQIYLENLVKRNHITESQKNDLENAFLTK